jgi:hypothetical protein
MNFSVSRFAALAIIISLGTACASSESTPDAQDITFGKSTKSASRCEGKPNLPKGAVLIRSLTRITYSRTCATEPCESEWQKASTNEYVSKSALSSVTTSDPAVLTSEGEFDLPKQWSTMGRGGNDCQEYVMGNGKVDPVTGRGTASLSVGTVCEGLTPAPAVYQNFTFEVRGSCVTLDGPAYRFPLTELENKPTYTFSL